MTRPRTEIELDLAFHVNGTLSAEEAADLEALLAEDAVLAGERDALAAIRTGMQAEDIRSPAEFGLARLMRDVGRAPVAQSAPGRLWMWQAVAAVAVALLLGQTLLQRGPLGAGYELAGTAVAGALVVSFVPSASEDQIRTLLVTQNLEIVAGPSALGLYRLEPGEGADLASATQALRAAVAIVESVENAEN